MRSTWQAGHWPAMTSAFSQPPMEVSAGRFPWTRNRLTSDTSTQSPPQSEHLCMTLSSPAISVISTLQRGQSMRCGPPPGPVPQEVGGSRSSEGFGDDNDKQRRGSTSAGGSSGLHDRAEGLDEAPQPLGVQLQGDPVHHQPGRDLEDGLLDDEPVGPQGLAGLGDVDDEIGEPE